MPDRPTGTLVLVVGPSGAGKDSVMDGARATLPADAPIRFVTRCITRPAEAGGEAHEAISAEAFEARLAGGGFALHWRAHGLRYGLPVDLEGWRAEGLTVVANASRGVLDAARAKYPGCRILHITASDPVLARRLAARGRESAAEIEARLAHAGDHAPQGPDVVTIVNDGDLADAVAAAREVLIDLSH